MSRSHSTGFSVMSGNRSGTRSAQAVIDIKDVDASRRRAKVAFFVGLVAGALVSFLAANFSTQPVNPATGLFAAAIGGGICGVVAFVVATVWPVLRAVWHWGGEIVLVTVFLSVYVPLGVHVSGLVASLVVVTVIGLPLALPKSRAAVRGWWNCMVVRHRVRVACDSYLEGKGTRGSVMPLILVAKPIPAGERVWLWLRGDLTLEDVQGRLTELATTCWAQRVEASTAGNKAAYVKLDIYRKDSLAAVVKSPLLARIIGASTPPVIDELEPVDPEGVNLDEVPSEDAMQQYIDHMTGKKSKKTDIPRQKNNKKDGPTVAGDDGDDLSDWV